MSEKFIIENGVFEDYLGDDAHVVIPEGVTAIGNSAFFYEEMESVVIPEGVTSIEEAAFGECRNLVSVSIPTSVVKISEAAFGSCEKLESIVIPEGVTEIGIAAFSECNSLRSIVIPDSVTEIEEVAFWSCSALESVELPKGLTEIEDSVFMECKSLKSIVIPEGVTKIGDCAFDKCYALKSIVIPDSVVEIADAAFMECYRLESVIIPSKLERIGERVFARCESLSSIVIPEGVTEIDFEAFEGCMKLKEVVIPESLVRVDDYAFDNCSPDIEFKKADGTKVDISDYFDEPLPEEPENVIPFPPSMSAGVARTNEANRELRPDDDGRVVIEAKDQNGNSTKITFAANVVEECSPELLFSLLADLGIDIFSQDDDENEDEPPEEWQLFEVMDDDERACALHTRFEFDGDYASAGWARPEVWLNGEHRRYRISYIGDSVGDFRDAVNGLGDGDTMRFSWLDEPGCYTWYISRQGDYVYVKAPLIDEGAYMRYDEFREAVEAGGGDHWK